MAEFSIEYGKALIPEMDLFILVDLNLNGWEEVEQRERKKFDPW